MVQTPRNRAGLRLQRWSTNFPSLLDIRQDRHGRDGCWTADVVRQRYSSAVHLILCFATKLIEQFVTLSYAGGARRVPFGLEAAARVDRNRSADIVLACLDDLVCLETIRKPEILITDELDTGEAVMDLGDVD